MITWKAIYVFGYGESHVIGREVNCKVDNTKLTSINILLTSLSQKAQEGTKISLDEMHSLNISNNSFIDFLPKSKGNKSQRFTWSDVDVSCVNTLFDEIIANKKIRQKLPISATRK